MAADINVYGTLKNATPDGTLATADQIRDGAEGKMQSEINSDFKERIASLESSGTGGTDDYNELDNKPSIDGVPLEGNKSLDELGIQGKGDYATREELQKATPSIGENGNWYIGGSDTGRSSKGADGVSLGEVALVQETGTGSGSEKSVMSQKTVTEKLHGLEAYNTSRFTKKSIGTNIFDKDSITRGYFLDGIGNYQKNELYGYSGYMEVAPSSQYTLSGFAAAGAFHCLYDQNGIFISSVAAGNSSNQTLNTPDNAKYLRISLVLSRADTAQVEIGAAATGYQPYSDTFNTDVKIKKTNAGANGRYVFSKKGKNILNPDTFVVGEWVMDTGCIGNVGYGIGRTDFIPIKEGESLTCSSKLGFRQCRAALYDKDFIPIAGTVTTDEETQKRTLTWVEGAEYAVFTFKSYPTDKNMDMVEYGSEVTSYERYYWNKELQEELDDLSILNGYFSKLRYDAEIFNKSGFLSSNGTVAENADYVCTDYIEIQSVQTAMIKTRAVWANEYGGGICFYDQNKTYIRSVYNTIEETYPGVGDYILTEIPQRAKYIVVCGAKDDASQYIEIYGISDILYNKIQEGSGRRKTVVIKKTESDVEILNKMIDCFENGNCDVYFETGEYIFQDAYIYMRDTLRWMWTMEFPIGGNCRYFFNNSVIKSIPPTETYETSRNVFGTKASASNFELYDGTIINQGGTYCVHDEADIDDNSYVHKYKNVNMNYLKGDRSEGLSKCIGGGAGIDGTVIIENCIFTTENESQAVSWHGSNNEKSGKMSFSIVGNYFNKGMSLDGALKDGDHYKIMFSNNSVQQESDLPNSSEWHEKYIFNNEVRSLN